MPTITTRDGAQIFYKDWGTGQPIVFSHGWPLNADAWDEQLYFFASNGCRAIAHDRRGHGRSTQTKNGNNMDTYADDLVGRAYQELDLKTPSTSVTRPVGGEVTIHRSTRHQRVAKACWSMPCSALLKRKTIRTAYRSRFSTRSHWSYQRPVPVLEGFRYSVRRANRPNAKISQGTLDRSG